MIKYPLQFNAKARASSGIENCWNAQSEGTDLKMAVPPEFEGPGGALSPEDLYAQALTNCFVATFTVLAEKSRVTYAALNVESSLVVDRDEASRPVMKAIHLCITVTGASDLARASRLVDKALQGGFILNSVKTKITHELVMDAGGAA
jgi:organic hydroperoxide reductase OsmC/OhrA